MKYDLVVLGGGSGGVACARRSAVLGAKVALIDAPLEIKKTEIDCDYIYLVGGGSRNQFISNKLSNFIPGKIKFINKLSLSDNYIESQAFAYLGIRSIKKLPISYPNTTGIRKALSGGDLY